LLGQTNISNCPSKKLSHSGYTLNRKGYIFTIVKYFHASTVINPCKQTHNMRSLRLLQDIGQKELAAKMNTSQNNISRLERGKIKMTEEKKKSAAEALGVSEEVLDHFHERHIFLVKGRKVAL
jgi:hypothetical protein